jgi:hypothetical protein
MPTRLAPTLPGYAPSWFQRCRSWSSSIMSSPAALMRASRRESWSNVAYDFAYYNLASNVGGNAPFTNLATIASGLPNVSTFEGTNIAAALFPLAPKGNPGVARATVRRQFPQREKGAGAGVLIRRQFLF